MLAPEAPERELPTGGTPEGGGALAPAGGHGPARVDRDGALAGLRPVGVGIRRKGARGTAGRGPPLEPGGHGDGHLELHTHVGARRGVGDVVAGITHPIAVDVLLIGVGHQRAVVVLVGDAIAVGVLDADQRSLVDATIAIVVALVAEFHAPVGGDAIEGVASVTNAVAILIPLVVGQQRAVVAGVATPVAVGVDLVGVGGVQAVVPAVGDAIAIDILAIGIREIRGAIQVAIDAIGAQRFWLPRPLVPIRVFVGDAHAHLGVTSEAVDGLERLRTERNTVTLIFGGVVVDGVTRDGGTNPLPVLDDATLLERALDPRAGIVVARPSVAPEGALLTVLGIGALPVGTDTQRGLRHQSRTFTPRNLRLVANHVGARVGQTCPSVAPESACFASQLRVGAGAIDASTDEGESEIAFAGGGRSVETLPIPLALGLTHTGFTPMLTRLKVAHFREVAHTLETPPDALGHERAVADVRHRFAVGILTAVWLGARASFVDAGDTVVVDAVADLLSNWVDAAGARREACVLTPTHRGELPAHDGVIAHEPVAVADSAQGGSYELATGLCIGTFFGARADDLDNVTFLIGREAIPIGVGRHDPRVVVVVDDRLALFGQVGATLSASGEGDGVGEQPQQRQHGEAGGLSGLGGAVHGLPPEMANVFTT